MSVFEGETYFFCSQSCLERFRANPRQYLGSDSAGATSPHTPAPAVSRPVEYTCPMHPEVRQRGPGTCPTCGMALEPRTVTTDEDNPELKDMTRRFWVSLAFSAPLLIIAMLEHAEELRRRGRP